MKIRQARTILKRLYEIREIIREDGWLIGSTLNDQVTEEIDQIKNLLHDLEKQLYDNSFITTTANPVPPAQSTILQAPHSDRAD